MYIYILKEFRKLVIIFLTYKNTLNLINSSLFQKNKKNMVKTVNRQKLITKKVKKIKTLHNPHLLLKNHSTFYKNKKLKLKNHRSVFYNNKKKWPISH